MKSIASLDPSGREAPALDRLARKAFHACHTLATFTEVTGTITRTFLSPPTRDVHHFLAGWMHELGLLIQVDAAGNLRGLYPSPTAGAPRLILASHIDTVPNAGAFDGILGVTLGLALIEALQGQPLSFEIELIAFSEEEGVRYSFPFIGSRALTGQLDPAILDRTDAAGVPLHQAIASFGLDPSQLPAARLSANTFAYLEFHIEQGPVLESLDLSLGVVTSLVGQTRMKLAFHGFANHAGTTPMHLRRDALAAAAEWVIAVEHLARSASGLVATVGHIVVAPSAANVIPGTATLSLDLRGANDTERIAAVDALLDQARSIADSRGLTFEIISRLDQSAVPLHPGLTSLLRSAASEAGHIAHRIVSGAGHDAMILAPVVPACMLFLRSPGGISHHPDESVLLPDITAALATGLYFLQRLHHNPSAPA